MQTIRSHDQFNTTIYGLSDRYRGIENGRRVVLLHRDDIAALGFEEGDVVDVVSEWEDGSQREVPSFRLVAYDVPRGCCAAYYPETNPLVPLEHTAEGSNQPVSKAILVRLEPANSDHSGVRLASDEGVLTPAGRGDESKRAPSPTTSPDRRGGRNGDPRWEKWRPRWEKRRLEVGEMVTGSGAH